MAFAGGGAQAREVRVLAIVAALAACGPSEPATPAHGPRMRPRADAAAAGGTRDDRSSAGMPVGPAAPRGDRSGGDHRAPADGAPVHGRLGDAVVPVRYDVTLDVDPAREAFAGHVEIALTAAPGTQRIWLHAEVQLVRAALIAGDRRVATAIEPGDGPLRALALAQPIAGAATLILDYTGSAPERGGAHGDEEGLFRERWRGRWYLYSQAESSFARRIVPCFDEPRFKPAWRVTAIVPRGLVALGNGATQSIARGAVDRVTFAAVDNLPSHLLALAVGPFALVDAGTVGRRQVPVRLAVMAGDAAQAPELARIVTALERYTDLPLPLAKLDLVAVPEFFGAMENPGLITIERDALVGGRERVAVLAHELAHQWFGNLVTPAWWDHLWLSEAFATWLATKIADELGAQRTPLAAHRARAEALAADDAPDARPILAPIAPGDAERAFDAISYEKGGALLAMFERLDPAAFRRAVVQYLAKHAGRAVTSQAFLDELARATSPRLARALLESLTHAGAPTVTLSCRAHDLVAEVAPALPICVRIADQPRCFLAGEPGPRIACPRDLVGNDGGRGYYRVSPRGVPAAPFAALTDDEKLARGDDLAAAIARGELPAREALAEALQLSATRDPLAGLVAITLGHALVAELIRAWIRPWTTPG